MARITSWRKASLWGAGALAIAAVGGVILLTPERATAQGGSFVRDGQAAFVITQFAYALGPDAQGTEHCPDGMTKTIEQIFAETPGGQMQPGEGEEQYNLRVRNGSRALGATADGKNFCLHPELAPHDPYYRILSSPTALAEGIDLDGEISRSRADLRSGRLDFTSPDGTKGVDNQFRRLTGCNTGYQSSGQANSFAIEMYSGSWGILIALDGVDDIENDDHIDVRIAANADPIRLSPSRDALEYATYSIDPDERFVAETTGRIENGVLKTEPVDVRFHQVVNAMHLERPLRDARIQATLSPGGVLKGYLGGYTPVEELYNYQFGYRDGKNGDGTDADLGRRLGSSNGAAGVLGHTCHGVYQSLYKLADGHPDPETGKFTSISNQYSFEARPAFVTEAQPAPAAKKTES